MSEADKIIDEVGVLADQIVREEVVVENAKVVSDYGSKIQRKLSDKLLKMTPFVLTEATTLKIDVLAYIPDWGQSDDGRYDIERLEPNKVHCHEMRSGNLCGAKYWALRQEAEMSDEDRREYLKEKWPSDYQEAFEKHKQRQIERAKESGRSPPSEAEIDTYFPLYYCDHERAVPHYNLQDKYWEDLKEKDLETMVDCTGSDCPSYRKFAKIQAEARKKWALPPGLHAFEIKGNLDTHARLIHQIPQMIKVADYVWLVVGSDQKIPDWLPPYISVLRYDDASEDFKYERSCMVEGATPLYWQTLTEHGIGETEARTLRFLNDFVRKWNVNSMFNFHVRHSQPFDMKEDIELLRQYATKYCRFSLDSLDRFTEEKL